MFTVTTVFDPETRVLSYKEGSDRWAGTTEDNHSAQIVVEGIEALLDEYTAELVFGIPMYNNGVIYHPIGQIDAETQTYVLPNAILASARDGILPTELRLTKDSKVITSRNRLEISVVTAIDALRPFDGAYLPEIMGRSQEWAPDVQYAKGAIVIRDEVLYYSGRADNLGHDPKDGNISWWGEVSIVAIREYQTYIGDGVATQFTIAHHMLSPDLQFTVTHNGVDKTGDVTDMAVIDENNAVFTFSSPPQADTLLRINKAYRAISSPMWVWGMLESEEGMVAPEALFGVLEITDEKVTVRNGELGVNSSGRAYAGPEGLTKVLANEEDLEAHIIRTDNPHSVTKEQLGLQNVDPTSDLNKPISIATQTALNLKANSSDLTAHTGNTANPHSVTKAQVGLGNVDNTSDANKPVSTATQTALNGKVTANTAITAGTKAKITYDAKGLVTAGADLVASHIPNLNASKINAGTLGVDRIPNISANKITSDTLADARIPSNIERNTNKIQDIQSTIGYTGSDTDYPSVHAVQKYTSGVSTPILEAISDLQDDKADDDKVVHKAGNETITGIKSFENNVNIGTTSAPKNLVLKGDLTIEGDIVQNGSSYETHAEKVFTANDKIITREGAVSGLAAGETTGFTAKKYDGTNDGELALDNSGTIRVGDVGDTQPVLTRRESADLSSNGLLAWDPTGLRAITRTLLAGDIPSLAASKITSGTFSDARIPTSIERTSNKISSWQTTPTDTAYPTEKLVKDSLDAKATASDLSSHTSNTSNPHSVTKAQVGLSNVDNTSDAAKPISTATQTALDGKADSLGLNLHRINTTNPHSVTKAQVGLSNVDNTSDAAKPISTATQTALDGKADSLGLNLHRINTTNPHSVTKAQVGLGNVDNTSDLAKPISTATQTALDGTVKKTGNESIAGIKTFSDNVEIGTTLGPKQLSIKGNLLIDGNITQNGSTYETHAQQVYTTDDKIIMRDGATAGLVAGDTSGLTFKKYDGTNDGELSVDSSGTARVGDVGDLQPLATRNEAELMTDNQPVVWDSSGLKMVTRALVAGDIPNLDAGKIKSGTIADARIPSGITRDTELTAHTSKTDNPHSVTKAQVGLGNVNNTSDVNKPISTATQTALDSKQDTLTFDDAPVSGSSNPVKSGGVHSALAGKVSKTGYDYISGVKTFLEPVLLTMRANPGLMDAVSKGYLDDRLSSKQDALTFDDAPVSGSNNPVKSSGIYTALAGKQGNLTFDDAPVSGSNNPVKSSGIYTALAGKQDNLTFDNAPVSGSDNPVKSGGVYSALTSKADISTLNTHSGNENNPHSVTKAQVGLGNVDNTSDVNKPISTAMQNALDGKVPYLTGTHTGGIELDKVLRVTYENVGDIEFNYVGVGRHHMIRADSAKLSVNPAMDGVLGTSAMEWYRGAGGEPYALCKMRSSPGTSDVVNVGYVNNRVTKMANYIQEEVNRLTDVLTAKITEEVTAKVAEEVSAKMAIDSTAEMD